MLDLLLALAEALAADLVQGQPGSPRADVALDHVDPARGHIEGDIAAEDQVEVLLLSCAALHALEPLVPGEPVDCVDHQVTGPELEDALEGLHLVLVGTRAHSLARAEGAL